MWTQHHNGKINEAIGDINLCNIRALCSSHGSSAPTERKKERKNSFFCQSSHRIELSFENCVHLTGSQSCQPSSLTQTRYFVFIYGEASGTCDTAAICSWHCSCVFFHCLLFHLQISLFLLGGKWLGKACLF